MVAVAGAGMVCVSCCRCRHGVWWLLQVQAWCVSAVAGAGMVCGGCCSHGMLAVEPSVLSQVC